MDQLDKFNRRYNFLSKLSAAFFYSIAVAIALNFFHRERGHGAERGAADPERRQPA